MKAAMSREFTAVFEKHGQWYIGYVEEIPGVNTQGKTLAEARENLKEALQLILEENRRVISQGRSATTKREPITVRI